MGGVNLVSVLQHCIVAMVTLPLPHQLEQAEEQERLLEASAREMEQRKKKEAELRQQLQKKEAERVDMEERYASLQEEAVAKTRKLKEVWRQFQGVKEEVRAAMFTAVTACHTEHSTVSDR